MLDSWTKPESDQTADGGSQRSWLPDSNEVYSAHARGNHAVAPEVDAARAVLEAEGIPAYVDVVEERPEPEDAARLPFRWRILVPGQLNMRATSVLERDIFNDEFIETWKNRLEMISDEELRQAEPEYIFCGLFDRVRRVGEVWPEEIERRALPSAVDAAEQSFDG